MALTGYIKNGDKFEKIGVGINIPVGMILPWFLNKDVPVGFIRVLDTWYDSATYPTLDAMYGDTYGRQNGKFRLPPVWDNRFLEGGSIAGELKDAGLPNIEGLSGLGVGTSFGGLNGAFSINQATSTIINGVSVGTANCVKIDASLSNPAYGKSNTVQPKAITVVWIIKAFEGASLSSTDIEITNLANEFIQFKADTDYIVDSGRSSDGSIWYRKWKSGWLEQGGIIFYNSDGEQKTTNFIKHFASRPSIISNWHYSGSGTSNYEYTNVTNVTENGFTSRGYRNYDGCRSWYACGQGGND